LVIRGYGHSINVFAVSLDSDRRGIDWNETFKSKEVSYESSQRARFAPEGVMPLKFQSFQVISLLAEAK